jgi:hypothetical protein
VARLLRNLLQNHVAQITHAKQPHRPASATAKSTPSFTKLAESFMATVVSVPATTAKAVPVSIVPMSLSTALLFSVETSEMFNVFVI